MTTTTRAKKTISSLFIMAIFAVMILAGCGSNTSTTTTSGSKETATKTSGAETYKVDPQASTIKWTAKKVTGQHNGTVNIADGDIFIKSNKIEAGKFNLDMSTIKVLDITDQGSNDKLTNHLKSDDFFSAEKHKNATFEITNVSADNEISGNLTIKGISKNITIPATVNVSGDKLTASSTFDIDRTEYDIKFRSGKFFENLGDNMINDNFTLELNIVANKVK